MSSPPKRSNTAAPSPPRPSSPPPGKGSMRARMSTAMRRASTGLSITQALSRTSSKSSLKDSLKVSTDSTPAPPSVEDARPGVSPVAESPAREEAANLAEGTTSILRPSPLANVVVTEPTPEPTPGPTPALELSVTASPEQIPGELPHQTPVTPLEAFGFGDSILPTTTSKPTNVESPQLLPQDAPAIGEPVSLPELTPAVPLPPPTVEPEEPIALEDGRQDYFSYGDPVVAATSAPPPKNDVTGVSQSSRQQAAAPYSLGEGDDASVAETLRSDTEPVVEPRADIQNTPFSFPLPPRTMSLVQLGPAVSQ
ncbi:hypothetical protein DICSQDRAFT_180088 [Dichomitus squalens LYAD-421 SS1]|uniref:Uncharacterized protein n=1 Tax=Dichomitus squalens (strain LYAD-421) TaxID=732165 RepID=R7T1T6_DICSQ|nr:uncharacterized protein DICSQDRAFT_180088 [Dichomitus squalens LYAD-421 SS1]EJF62203.1 hypothetical protein DICSQDRAFT_180088 [Dichomitus squalens LYAD-421 SS1]